MSGSRVGTLGSDTTGRKSEAVGPRLTNNIIMLQKIYYIFYSKSVYLSDRAISYQEGRLYQRIFLFSSSSFP